MKLRSAPAIWKPTAAESAKKLAGPCEISALALKAGAGAAFISLYDGTGPTDVVDANLKWVLDASTTDSDNQSFPAPLNFRKGVYAICEQGINFNPILCIASVDYLA